MKGLDALVIDVDEADVVERRQPEVRRVIVDAAAFVPAEKVEEALIGRPIEEVFPRVELEADIDADLPVRVENRSPAPGELLESGANEIVRPRRPRIEIGPCQSARESDMRIEAEIAAGAGAERDLLGGPLLAGFRIAPDVRRGESVERLVVGRIDGDEST